MSEEEKALMLVRMVDECKTVRSDLVSLKAKAREISIGLSQIGGTLSNPQPNLDIIHKHSECLIPAGEILALVDEINRTTEREVFLSEQLKAASIIVN